MHRVFNGVVRGVVTAAVVVSLAAPAVARTRDEQRVSSQPKRPDVVQMLKRWVVAFGDGLTVPRP